MTDSTVTAPSRIDVLATTLRGVAARASEHGGGKALVFAHAPQEAPSPVSAPLRAAAGFGSEEEARNTALASASVVRDCQETGRFATAEIEDLGCVNAIPISCEGRTWGALVVTTSFGLTANVQQILGSLAETAALRTDHVWLALRNAELEEKLGSQETSAADPGDEILKLSEALFAQDIELLRSTEKLNSVQKLKSDFIEKMSRELRTPLNGIIEAIISVLAGENENLSDTAKGNLRCALDDGTSFLRTLQNILDLWRIKQGELPVEIQEVNFREVVEEAIFSVQDTIGSKPVKVEKHFDEPLPKIRTDLAKINQVLFLLLDNACKFTTSGSVEIRTSVNEDATLRCEIIDSGIGICADDRDFVFEEFFQVDPTTSSTYRGAGLGLTLVRDLLTLMDGEIEMESEVGRGTHVVFSVPVQPIR
jgi:signal transduction histidine kinase